MHYAIILLTRVFFIVLFIRRPIFNVCALTNWRECVQTFQSFTVKGLEKMEVVSGTFVYSLLDSGAVI